jgi:hypothetical protein
VTGFVKLDCGIVDSTVWAEPDDVFRAWIALLAKADAFGVVRCSIPALAVLCKTTPQRMVEIMDVFKSPDPFSRTPEDEGRRVREIDGAFLLINYVKHREITQGKPGSHADRQRRYRERIAARDESLASPVTDKRHIQASQASPERHRDTEAEEEVEEARAIETANAVSHPSADADGIGGAADTQKTKRSDPIPYQAIVDIFNRTLTRLPKARSLTPKRRTLIRSAWQAAPERRSLEFWEALAAEYESDDFTNGTGPYHNGHEGWRPSLDYLLRADVVTRTFERAMDRMERAG